MMLDIATVLSATGARLLEVEQGGNIRPAELSPSDLARCVDMVSIDSREVRPEGLFFALRGERVDGHDFVRHALKAGALGCVIAQDHLEAPVMELPSIRERPDHISAGQPGSYLFVVPDPEQALQQLAAFWRRRLDPEVIGITGSIGKTTTKEVVAAMLGTYWPVLKSEANLNTELGLPLTLLHLRPEHRIAVLEMGMYAPGDIALLTRIAMPRFGIVTNVAPIHLERMKTIERIARAKSELVAGIPPTGYAILNGDNPWTRAMAVSSGLAPTCLIGLAPDCDVRARDVTPRGLDGVSFVVDAEGRSTELHTCVPGTHTLHAFLAGIAVARALGVGWQEIADAAATVRLDVRQRIVHAAERLLIIDDSYNAAPPSMKAALELLRSAPGAKIAVLGDMLELGQHEVEAHQEVGESAAAIADWLVVRGTRSSWIAEGAERGGLPPQRIIRVASNADAVTAVRDLVTSPTVKDGVQQTRTMQRAKTDTTTAGAEWSVLVKGSRGMRMEEIVRGLRGEEE